jgi:hypothetical protein
MFDLAPLRLHVVARRGAFHANPKRVRPAMEGPDRSERSFGWSSAMRRVGAGSGKLPD